MWEALEATAFEILAGSDAGEVYACGKGGPPTGELREAATARPLSTRACREAPRQLEGRRRWDAPTMALLLAAELRDGSGSLTLGLDPGRLSMALGRKETHERSRL
jgi:hypothetical protein